MHEVGFVIHHVDEEGFGYLMTVGLHDDRTLTNQVLTVHTEKGPIQSLTGGKPAHVVSKEEGQKVPRSRRSTSTSGPQVTRRLRSSACGWEIT